MATTDQEISMPSAPQWSELPAELLFVVSNFFDTEIDYLRLRSVCTPWRSSLPPRPRKISFPLKLPIPSYKSVSWFFDSSDTVDCYLEETTFYRLSLPDSSNTWLCRICLQNPNTNTFTFQHPLLPHLFSYPPGVLPNQLNLLDYCISEICRSYSVKLFNGDSTIRFRHRKVISCRDVANCDFTALMVHRNGRMSYWRLGDEDWTPIDIKDFYFHDVILHQGQCYAVDRLGALVSIDSEFNMSVAAPPAVQNVRSQNQLVEYRSELYMVSSAYPQYNISPKLELKVSKLNKCNDKWDPIADLGDAVLFLGVEASFSVCTEDFHGCKGNRVYLSDDHFTSITNGVDTCGVYDLDEGRSLGMSEVEDFRKMFLPEYKRVTETTNFTSWQPPPFQWIKINSDAHMLTGGGFSVGVVARDEHGVVIAAGIRSYTSPTDVVSAKAFGVLFGVEFCKRLGIRACVILESDSLPLIEGLNGDGPNLSCFGSILEKIKRLAAPLWGVSFSYVGRAGNTAAHYVSCLVPSSGCEEIIVSDFPQGLKSLAELDI